MRIKRALQKITEGDGDSAAHPPAPKLACEKKNRIQPENTMFLLDSWQ